MINRKDASNTLSRTKYNTHFSDKRHTLSPFALLALGLLGSSKVMALADEHAIATDELLLSIPDGDIVAMLEAALLRAGFSPEEAAQLLQQKLSIATTAEYQQVVAQLTALFDSAVVVHGEADPAMLVALTDAVAQQLVVSRGLLPLEESAFIQTILSESALFDTAQVEMILAQLPERMAAATALQRAVEGEESSASLSAQALAMWAQAEGGRVTDAGAVGQGVEVAGGSGAVVDGSTLLLNADYLPLLQVAGALVGGAVVINALSDDNSDSTPEIPQPDVTAPIFTSLSSSATYKTITLTYNEALDAENLPATDDFTIFFNGSSNVVETVDVDGNQLVLTMTDAFDSGAAISFSYTKSSETDAILAIQDRAGNDASSFSSNFSSGIVADGYIRNAQIYLDANRNGVADDDELVAGVVTNSRGNFYLPTDANPNGYAILAVGGVNTDTGIVNQMVLKAPAGYSVINPITTLVQTLVEIGEASNTAAAVTQVATAFDLGEELDTPDELLNYNPLQELDDSENTNDVALNLQKAATQVASIIDLAVTEAAINATNSNVDVTTAKAATSSAMLSALAVRISDAAESSTQQLSLNDSDTLDAVFTAAAQTAGSSVSFTAAKDDALVAASSIANSATLVDIVQAQSDALDKISPNVVTLTDMLTNNVTPTITVLLDVNDNEGGAAVKDDQVRLQLDGTEIASYTLTSDDIEQGRAEIALADSLTEGDYSIIAVITDRAGNDSDASESATLQIDITAPVITSTGSPTVTENSDTDTVIYTATSNDVNASFTLTGIDAALLAIDETSGEVTLQAAADYETQTSYSFNVVATDMAGNHSEQAVTLSVINVDEVVPVVNSADTARISINTATDRIFYTAAVRDEVADDSFDVTYTLDSRSDAIFTIDAESGAVSLNSTPSDIGEYQFYVIASDSAGNSEPLTVTVTVIESYFTSDSSVVLAEENSTIAVTYPLYNITHAAGESAILSLISGAGDSDLFQLTGSSISFSTETTLDYETKSSYAISVGIDVDGDSEVDEQFDVVLNVTNIDETGPTFTSSTEDAVTTLAENSSELLIYEATAIDTDYVGDAPSITYTLGGTDAAAFTIDSATGAVSLAATPDYETATSYTYSVIATDGAERSNQQDLTLTITNLDEDAPQFTASSPVTVAENIGAGQVVHTATATDTTDGGSDNVTYLLAEVDDYQSFTINTSSGAVSLIADPDFETKSEYTFTVVASDDVGNSSEQQVTLTISDVDEIAPVITISSDGDSDGNGTFIFTFDISEAVDNFAIGDITISNGSASGDLTPVSGVENRYQLEVTPTESTSAVALQLSVAAGQISDAAGNSNPEAVADSYSIVYGTSDDDTLSGSDGDDRLYGFDGSDLISGGLGSDMINLAETVSASDTIQYSAVAESSADTPDSVSNFVSGSDKIDISAILSSAGYNAENSINPGSADSPIAFENLVFSGNTVSTDVYYNGETIAGFAGSIEIYFDMDPTITGVSTGELKETSWLFTDNAESSIYGKWGGVLFSNLSSGDKLGTVQFTLEDGVTSFVFALDALKVVGNDATLAQAKSIDSSGSVSDSVVAANQYSISDDGALLSAATDNTIHFANSQESGLQLQFDSNPNVGETTLEMIQINGIDIDLTKTDFIFS